MIAMKRIPQILMALLVVFAASASQGQTIKSANTIKRGLPVHLEVVGDDKWDVVSWKVDWPLDFQKGTHYFENGSNFYSAIPCSGVDRIKVGVTVINWESKQFKQLDYSIAIDDPPTKPDDPPEDDDPKDDYTKSPVYMPVLAEVKVIKDKSGAGKAASNFETVAKQIEDGTVRTKIELWNAVSNLNVEALGDLREYWQQVGKTMQFEFGELKVADFKGYAFHLRAVAAAIREGIK